MERKRKLEVDDGPSKKLETAVDGYNDPNGGVILNPYTGKPYSKRYYDILQKRRGELLSCCLSCFRAMCQPCGRQTAWIALSVRCYMRTAAHWAEHPHAAAICWLAPRSFAASVISSSLLNTLKPPVMLRPVHTVSPQACLSGRPKKTL
eukprot:GHUV01036753.1.p1 GENE.GHUV01036753.1~~GHUV01036753.1.p1  ORF type:complete len:149 (+),score=10.59 GHUV01036753.1:109-555(+)